MTTSPSPLSTTRLVLALCAAEVLTMVGVFAYPALLPTLSVQWSLTKTEAGWIAGMYFAGYAIAAPPLLALTDRVDAKRIFAGGALAGAASFALFALLAEGFWSALALRTAAGAALAATYMPGVRALADRYRGAQPSRAIAAYTACFSLGTAMSYFLTGAAANAFGWRAAFALAAAAALAATAIAAALPAHPPQRPTRLPRLRDLGAVARNRRAMGFILAYGAHCWELFTMRSWLVAFLAAALASEAAGGATPPWLAPADVAALSGLAAMVASFGGNEIAIRVGRVRLILVATLASGAAATVAGFTAGLGYSAAAAAMIGYTALVQLDSGALTAGVVGAAAPDRKGATLALHALIGFGSAGVGPLVMGVILDATGGAWGLAFASLALVAALGASSLVLTKAAPTKDDDPPGRPDQTGSSSVSQ